MSDIINSLADLADVDTTGYEAASYEALPIGVYAFMTSEPEVTSIDPKEEGGAARFRISIPHKVVDVATVASKTVDHSMLMGKVHNESFIIDLGKENPYQYLLAYARSVEVDTNRKLGEWLPELGNLTVIAKVNHRRNPNDPATPYVSLRDVKLAQ